MAWKTSQKQLASTIGFTAIGIITGSIVSGRAGVVVGMSSTAIGLCFSLWFEIRDFSGHNKQVQTSIRQLEAQMERRIIYINPLILSDVALRDAVTKLLAEIDGLEFVKRSCIISDAVKQLDLACYDLQFPRNYHEELRVLLLCDVIANARGYVFAFSYADRDHLDRFWNEHRNPALPKYMRAHEEALRGNDKPRSFSLKRVFVYSLGEFKRDPETCRQFCRVLEDLLKRGMRDLYIVTDTDAQQAFEKSSKRQSLPERSFFLADDVFLSEGRAEKVPNAKAYARFAGAENKDIGRCKSQFNVLLGCGRLITIEDVKALARASQSAP